MGVISGAMTAAQLAEYIAASAEFADLATAIAQGGIYILETGEAVTTAMVVTGGAPASVVGTGTALELAAQAQIAATGTQVATSGMTLLKTSTGLKLAGLGSIELGACAAMCAPILGFSLGVNLYESNPVLWTKISQKLLPFCYPGTTKIPTILDIVQETGLYKALVKVGVLDALKELFVEEGIGVPEGHTSSLNTIVEQPVALMPAGTVFAKNINGWTEGAYYNYPTITYYYNDEEAFVNYRAIAVSTSPGDCHIQFTDGTHGGGGTMGSYTHDGKTVYYKDSGPIGSSAETIVAPVNHYRSGGSVAETAWTSVYGDPVGGEYPEGVTQWEGETITQPEVWPYPIIIVPDPIVIPEVPETVPLTPIPLPEPIPALPAPDPVPQLPPYKEPETWPEEEPWPETIPFPWPNPDPETYPDWPEVIPWPLPPEQPEQWPTTPEIWPETPNEPQPETWPDTPEEWPEEIPWPEIPEVQEPENWPEELPWPWPESPEEWPDEYPWPAEVPEDWPGEIPDPWPDSPNDWPDDVPWPTPRPDDWPEELPWPWPERPEDWPDEYPWPTPWPEGWPEGQPWPVKWPHILPYPYPYPDPTPSPDPEKKPDPYAPPTPEEVDPRIDPSPIPWPYPDPTQPTTPTKPTDDPSQPYRRPSDPTEPVQPTPPPPEGESPEPPTPTIPLPFSTTTGLISVYHPNQGQLLDFANWLWVTWQDASIDKIWNNPFDGVITLFELYCTPTDVGSKTIRSGFLDSGVLSNIISRYTTLDCGSITIPEYYGNYLDYTPYTKAYVYLPFIGVIELNADDVVGHAVNITYNIDEYNGSCIALITVAKVTTVNGVNVEYSNVFYQFSGNCAVELPLAGGSQAAIKAGMIEAAAWGIGSVVGGIMGGNSIGDIAQGIAYGAGSAVHSITAAKSSVQHSGSFGSSYGAMGIKTPFITVVRPKQVEVVNYNEMYGYQAHKAVNIGDCRGYLRCREVHVISPTASNEEKDLIEELLKTGVYVTE